MPIVNTLLGIVANVERKNLINGGTHPPPTQKIHADSEGGLIASESMIRNKDYNISFGNHWIGIYDSTEIRWEISIHHVWSNSDWVNPSSGWRWPISFWWCWSIIKYAWSKGWICMSGLLDSIGWWMTVNRVPRLLLLQIKTITIAIHHAWWWCHIRSHVTCSRFDHIITRCRRRCLPCNAHV